MSGSLPSLCLVAPGHVASTPRLVKAADALAAAGYQVHVVAGRNFAPVDSLDAEIFASARWTHTRVTSTGGARAWRQLLRRLARLATARFRPIPLRMAARVAHAEALHLGAIAARTPAQLYLGYCLASLPAVAAAARARDAVYGFDAEDYYGTETAAVLADRAEIHAIRALQTALLPGCGPFFAASPLIAAEYQKTYGLTPQVILNVFPLSEAPAAAVDPGPISAERPARIYWFSQTIGLGRGLEAAVAILGRLRHPVELHLRGFVGADYRQKLQALAKGEGLARPIQFLPPASASEMVRLAADSDLGLAIEESEPLNRDLCLTNKVFAYLLAGVPQLLSPTSAQSALAPDLGEAALLASLGHPEATAQRLDTFLGDASARARARRAAWELARRRYCWDLEKDILLGSVKDALTSSGAGLRA